MSEKLEGLKKGAAAANTKRTQTSSARKESFIPGIVGDNNEAPAPAAAPTERIVMGRNRGQVTKPIPPSTGTGRTKADFSTLPEDVNENIKESPQAEILKPGGVFEKYIAQKKEEAEQYLADKTFGDDEIEQTPDAEIPDAEETSEDQLDDDEKELEEAYATQDFKNDDYDSEMGEEDEYDEEYGEEEMIEENADEEVDDVPPTPKKPLKVVPADLSSGDDYQYPENYDLPSEEEMFPESDTDDEEKVKLDVKAVDAKVGATYNIDVATPSNEEDLGSLLDQSDDDEEMEAALEDLKSQITEKIKPVAAKKDISTFTIVKSAKVNNKLIGSVRRSAAKWVLPATGIIFEMSELGGSEIEYLRENNRNDPTELRNSLRVMYDHIVTPKPPHFEDWLKSIAYLDHDHLFMGAYIAGFSGSNHVPYTCEKQGKVGCNKMFLSDNLPIMDMIHFESQESKEKFYDLYESTRTNGKGLYTSEIVPISEYYAVGLVIPSLYSVYFENGSFSTEFRRKYSRTIGFAPYIDTIYRIDNENQRLVEIAYQKFANNPGKTAKSKIICYSKIIDSLRTDEYSNFFALVASIDDRSNWFEYQVPETSCPVCKRKINAESTTARELVFTRHRLGLLANTSTK